MFFNCSSLTSLDVSGFDTSNVTTMRSMFNKCESLKSLDVSGFDTSKVTTMYCMFGRCLSITSLDLSSFDTSNVISMEGMFKYNNLLTTIYVSDKWTTEKVDDLEVDSNEQFFYNCTRLVGGAGTTYDANHIDITYARVDGGPNSLYPGYLTLKTTPKTLVAGTTFNKNVKATNTVSTSDTTVKRIVFDYWRYGYLEGGTYIYNDSDWGNGTAIDADGLGEIRLFKSADGTTAYILSKSDIYANTDCTYMFYYFEGINQIIFNNFNTSKVTSMDRFFRNCKELQALDLTGFNVEKVTNMSRMFNGCTKLTTIKGLDTFNVLNATNMEGLFVNCIGLTSLDLSNFNTVNVTDMTRIFLHCSALTTIYVSDKWSIANVTTSDTMFSGCTSLVGGAGTKYNANNVDKTYARVDGGPNSETPGYLTLKSTT